MVVVEKGSISVTLAYGHLSTNSPPQFAWEWEVWRLAR